MYSKLFHIFGNTPLGRENLLQSIHFCRSIGCSIEVYIPESLHFLMYFGNSVIQIDLDSSYLRSPETARHHAKALVEQAKLPYAFFNAKNYTAASLPDIPVHFDFMCCPRNISDLSIKIGLGYIGPRVRKIVQAARFPILLTCSVYKPWRSVTVFYGGSANAGKAMRLAIRICKKTEMPLTIFTQAEGKPQEHYKKFFQESAWKDDMKQIKPKWLFFEKGDLEDNLYNVPHSSLVILGAYGHGLIKDFMFGSKMEKIQAILPNNLLIVGPKYSAKGDGL